MLLAFLNVIFYISLIFKIKINDDFKSWNPKVDSDSLLLKWPKIESGIIKLAKKSQNPIISELEYQYKENLGFEGKF